MRKVLFLLLFALTLFAACSPSYYGYGVILWTDNPEISSNGEVIKITSNSKRNKVYFFNDKDGAERTIPWWRVEFFETLEEAESYEEQFKPYVDQYVYSEKDGVPPVREGAGSSSNNRILYKFKAFFPAKVLSRGDEKAKIGKMEAFWYHVLAENQVPIGNGKFKSVGIKGYCFGYHLNEVTSKDISKESLGEVEGADTLIDSFFTSTWRPLYYRDMIRHKKIELEFFKSEWGLFADKENKKVFIATDRGKYSVEFQDIVKIRSGLYSFPETDLRIEFISDDKLSASYKISNRSVNTNFIKMDANIDEYIENEVKRKEKLFEDFISRGTKIKSNAYGTIEFDKDKSFYWLGLKKLIPGILPKNVDGRGKISFPYFLDSSLTSKYDGVISLAFNDYSVDKGVNFLYQFTEGGVKLFYLNNTNIEDKVVNHDGATQIIIFFTYQE